MRILMTNHALKDMGGTESWTMAEADIDSDVLEAYLESRRRNA